MVQATDMTICRRCGKTQGDNKENISIGLCVTCTALEQQGAYDHLVQAKEMIGKPGNSIAAEMDPLIRNHILIDIAESLRKLAARNDARIEELITTHFEAHMKSRHSGEKEGKRVCNEFIPFVDGGPGKCGLDFPHFDEEHTVGFKVRP